MTVLGSDRYGPMTLGNKPPFAMQRGIVWPDAWRETNGSAMYLNACADWQKRNPTKRHIRYHERIGYRQFRPWRPFQPGKHSTAKWTPNHYGRFSLLRQWLRDHYYAERYTGARHRPEDYVHHGTTDR